MEILAIMEFLQPYAEYWSYWWPQLVPAISNTLALTAFSYLFAVVLGIVLALGRLSKIRAVRAFCRVYIEFVRGIPALALLFLIYFGLVPLGIIVDSFTAAVVGLGLDQGAYMAEVFRGGIEALHKGQHEAAIAVGTTPYWFHPFLVIPATGATFLLAVRDQPFGCLKRSSKGGGIYTVFR